MKKIAVLFGVVLTLVIFGCSNPDSDDLELQNVDDPQEEAVDSSDIDEFKKGFERDNGLGSKSNSTGSGINGKWNISHLHLKAKKGITCSLEGDDLGTLIFNSDYTFTLSLDVTKHDALHDISGLICRSLVKGFIKQDIKLIEHGTYSLDKYVLTLAIDGDKPVSINFNEAILRDGEITLTLPEPISFPTKIGQISIAAAGITLDRMKV